MIPTAIIFVVTLVTAIGFLRASGKKAPKPPAKPTEYRVINLHSWFLNVNTRWQG